MIKIILGVIFSVLFTGCTTVSTVTTKSTLDPDDGLVIFKLSSDAQAIGFFRYWQGVKVKVLNEKYTKEFVIGYSSKGNMRSAVYLGSLPKGDYQLIEFSSEQCGAMCISSSVSLSKKMGYFSVKSGEVTDLGHFIYKPISNDKSLVVYGKTQTPWIPDYINQFYPNLAQSVSLTDFNGWNNPSEEMEVMYKEIQKRSNGLIRPFETSRGTVLFGSYLGQVREWGPNRGMRSLNTGSQGAIETVAELEDGSWVAGSENGKIFISKDKGVSWSEYATPFLNSSIIRLTPYHGKIFATVSTQENISIYYQENENGDWKKISEHPLQFSFWTGVAIYPDSVASKNMLVTTLPSNSLAVTDMDKLITVEKKFPGSISSFMLSNDGVLRCTAAKSLAVNPYESHDWGDTWVSSKHSRFMTLPYFSDDTHGFGLQGAWLSGKADLSTTEDGGETWQTKGPLPYRTPYFSHLKKSGNIYAWDGHNTIILDAGGEWVLQRL